jgi:hypothetical protein
MCPIRGFRFTGVSRDLPDPHRQSDSTKEYEGVRRSTKGYEGVRRSAKGYEGVRRGTKEYEGEALLVLQCDSCMMYKIVRYAIRYGV